MGEWEKHKKDCARLIGFLDEAMKEANPEQEHAYLKGCEVILKRMIKRLEREHGING